MRFATKHAKWTGYLTEEEFASYENEVSMREWCRKRMKDHEASISRLERKARDRMAEVKQSMKEAAE